MRSIRAAVPAVLAGLLLPAIAQTPSTATLRLDVPTGTTLRYALSTKSTTIVLGQTSTMTQKVTSIAKVVDRSEGKTTMEVHSEDVDVSTEGSAGMMPNQDQVVEQLKNTTVNAVYDELGAVVSTKTKGIDEESSQGWDMVVGLSTGFLGIRFAQEPVRVGSRWSVDVDLAPVFEKFGEGAVPVGQELKLPLEYRVTSIETEKGRTVATILVSADKVLKPKMNVGGSAPQELPMAWKMSGRYEVDARTGITVAFSTDAVMTMKIEQFAMKQFTRQAARLTSELPR